MSHSSEDPAEAAIQPLDRNGSPEVWGALAQEPVEGWGRGGRTVATVGGDNLEAVTESVPLTRGMGRSYGLSSLPPESWPVVASSLFADRILAFHTDTGELRCEAGLLLRDLNRISLPKRWFVPVTPGTASVTIGGMVASDVHGKNHHSAGTFGEYVTRLRIRVADGRIVECTPQQHADLFWATIGGMGLTGHILEVSFQMTKVPTPWIHERSERLPNLDAFLDRLLETAHDWPMSVGWVDCLSEGSALGRGHLNMGRWATVEEAPRHDPKPRPAITVPDIWPNWLLNTPLMRIFNELVYRSHWRRVKTGIVSPEKFFYPLDVLRKWNRMYGRTGAMTQYQCVLPHAAGRGATRALLELLRREGGACFLCVIKDCGAEGHGMLSYPMPGVSIALDLRITPDTPRIVERLNAFVIECGGRIYLTKDRFTTPEQFRAMEPRFDRFMEVRKHWDPSLRIRSAQSIHTLGDPP
jgi:decaprenylphospho-beta-D-ribofuranose 2-oxidase